MSPRRTPGWVSHVPDFYTYRGNRQREAGRRFFGTPIRVHGFPGEGATLWEWEQEMSRDFERGAALNLRDWHMMSPRTRRALLDGPRSQREPETQTVLQQWARAVL